MSPSFQALFHGNQQEARLGPQLVTSAAAIRFAIMAEPLRFTDLTLTNPTATPISVTVWVVPQGDVANDDNRLLGDVNISPNSLLTWNGLNIPLNLQDEMWAQGNISGVNLFGTFSRRNR